jgi:endonuclease-3
MAAPTKNQKIEALVKLVQKRSRGAGLTAPPKRTVLETLMYAALLENAPFDKADIAYTVLENYYIDWNEIRVCSVRELADTLTDLPNPEAAAERVRKALQGIFEKTYMFDLEEMRKKGKALTEHIKSLEAMSAGTPYMIQYAAQVALDGHLIPLDEASLRIMRRLGLSQLSSDGTQEICVGLDRVILKKSSLTFTAQLHHFAAGYYDVPDSPELLSQLSAIDPEAVSRSWASLILTPPSPPPTQRPATVPAGKPRSPAKEDQATSMVKPKAPAKETPAAKPAAKPLSKPASKKLPAKPTKKPAKKPVPIKPVPIKSSGKNPKKGLARKSPVTSIAKAKKTSPKTSKVLPGKKTALPKKPMKSIPPKKQAVVTRSPAKKSPAKPIKKTKTPVKKTVKKALVKKIKTVSPSKSLRKRKPK